MPHSRKVRKKITCNFSDLRFAELICGPPTFGYRVQRLNTRSHRLWMGAVTHSRPRRQKDIFGNFGDHQVCNKSREYNALSYKRIFSLNMFTLYEIHMSSTINLYEEYFHYYY